MGTIVETNAGRVEGFESSGVQVFRGIPYARPPVGELRFAAPEPPAPWADTRDATRFSLSAPQPPSPLAGMEVGEQGEDCLYLNVYTPAADAGRRPVLVWIHGGGFTTGSGSQPMYDGVPLVSRGDVVLVTINYRLGALGYLHLPELADAAANPGQLDQVAALEWVRDNVARFGGDPAQVTIFGESAGGMAVATLLGTPAARGLFRAAIPQSGAAHHTHDVESAGRVPRLLLGELGLGAGELAKLRSVPIARLLEAQASCSIKLQQQGSGLAFAPVVDGVQLPRPPLESVRAGECRDVALLVGSNRDENKLFSALNPALRDLDEARLQKRLAAVLRISPAETKRLIDAYRVARQGRASTEPRELLDAIESDRVFRIPAIRLAEAQRPHQARTFSYLVSWESPAMKGALGACHAVEIPFVFGTLGAPTMDRFAGSGAAAEALSERMMDAWLAFARTGDPSHPGLPDWPAYDAERRTTLTFDVDCAAVADPLGAERRAWDGLL